MAQPNDSDDPVKIGADLLLKGWIMLNKACPNCYQPLYKKDNRVVCVKCKQDYIIADSPADLAKKKKENEVSSLKSSPVSSTTSLNTNQFDFSNLPPALVETAKILMGKLSSLNNELKEATDPKRITELSDSIRSIVESLRSMAS